jgi:ribosomal-protein-alanine N-acetyltransferase
MTTADLDSVLAVARSLPYAPQWPRSAYQTAFNPECRPRRIALVAQDLASSAMAGFVVASFIPPDAELETIAVAAELQRRGLARQLFQAMVDELHLARIASLVLEVRASNRPARALYDSLGFTQTGLRPRYYADPVEDAILMKLKLD